MNGSETEAKANSACVIYALVSTKKQAGKGGSKCLRKRPNSRLPTREW